MQVSPNLAPATGSNRGVHIDLWCLQVLLATAFLMAGGSKLAGAEKMVPQFETIGLGLWFLPLTGALEVVAAVLLLIPGLAGYGALLLVPIMIGAAGAHIFVFHNNPVVPLVLLVLAAVVAWGRLVQTGTGTVRAM